MTEKCGCVFAVLSVGLPRDANQHKIINNGRFILLIISVYIFQKNITRLPFAIHIPEGEDRRSLQVAVTVAQLVESASHVQRLCPHYSGLGFESNLWLFAAYHLPFLSSHFLSSIKLSFQ